MRRKPVMRGVKGFTLIELLMVISIIVLLMTLLLPTLHRAKRLANAVACQSNLHQWGVAFSMYTNDNNGYFFRGQYSHVRDDSPLSPIRPYCDSNDLFLCPMAAKPKKTPLDMTRPKFLQLGDKFSAWCYGGIEEGTWYGSYDLNRWIMDGAGRDNRLWMHETEYWRKSHVKGATNIPVYLDSASPTDDGPDHFTSPPQFDGQPPSRAMWSYCINRHNGYVNCLFMDWSVRKVGLKELWTLKWSKEFDTTNVWTRSGGVLPEDWPEWMRNFKDY
jgi:prepilin-type N-terminal cleavage/methylation domain-containing protein/prepilin-type processing-associated H-X9-DG protein